MCHEKHRFRPTTSYWLKNWLPLSLALLAFLTFGVQKNLGTPKSGSVVNLTIFLLVLFLGFFWLNARKQVIVMPEGIFIQTRSKSYYWSWKQVTSVDFYAKGAESKQHLFISTENGNFEFELYGFDHNRLEDLITDQIGSHRVGPRAYRSTKVYREAEKETKRQLQRHGEAKDYVGGRVNNLLYVWAFFVGLSLSVISVLFANNGNWIASILFALFALVGFIRPLTLGREIYMNRDHVVCRRWFRTDMIWWRDVESIEASWSVFVFQGGERRLVCPGALYWQGDYAQRLFHIFNRQLEERQIDTLPAAFVFFPFNRKVTTKRFRG